MNIPIGAEIKIGIAVKNLKELQAVVEFLQGKGITPTATVAETPKAESVPSAEKGPKEREYLERAGLQRMRMLADGLTDAEKRDYGTDREGYAAAMLARLDTGKKAAVTMQSEPDTGERGEISDVEDVVEPVDAWGNIED